MYIKFPRRDVPLRPYTTGAGGVSGTKCGAMTVTGSNSFSGPTGTATVTDYTYVFSDIQSVVFPNIRQTNVFFWPFFSAATFSMDDRASYNYLGSSFQVAMCFYVDGQVINWSGSDPYSIYRNIGIESTYAAGSGGSPASSTMTYYMIPGYTSTDVPQQSWETTANAPIYPNGVSLYGKILKCTGTITAEFCNFTWSE